MNTKELEKRCNELFFQVNEKTERIAELEKENAELKKQLVEKGQHLDLTEKEWGKDLVQMYHFKNLYTLQTIQLTKAKELLKWFVWYFKEDYNYVPYKQKVKEAEQFLNSEVENEQKEKS